MGKSSLLKTRLLTLMVGNSGSQDFRDWSLLTVRHTLYRRELPQVFLEEKTLTLPFFKNLA